jgi:hypothetical protein
MASPAGLNDTLLLSPVGSVAGLANLVPKPDADQGYAETNGFVECATAMALPAGLKATPLPRPVGAVAGSANLVPKPEADQG